MFTQTQRRRLAVLLGEKSWFRKLSASLGWWPRPEKWIFIVGCYNSGTTLLQRILATHQEIGTLPREGVFLTDALPYPEQYGWTRMWHRCLKEMNRDLNRNPEARADRAKKQWSVWFPEGPSCLLEKSIANTTRMPFLQEYFQPAYFIHIVRNGYAVAEGIRRKANLSRWPNEEYGREYPIELCARQWAASLELTEKTCGEINNYLELTYENLVDTPAQKLKELFKFLGLDLPEEYNFNREWQIHEKKEPLKNMNPRSLARLSKAEIDKIKRIAGEYPKKYNYR